MNFVCEIFLNTYFKYYRSENKIDEQVCNCIFEYDAFYKCFYDFKYFFSILCDECSCNSY